MMVSFSVASLRALSASSRNPDRLAFGTLYRLRRNTQLFEIGQVLNFNIPAIEIFEGGYAPEGWQYRDARAGTVAEYVVALSKGDATLPMDVKGFPIDKDVAKIQAEFLSLPQNECATRSL
jgi:hypothetical protein